MEYKKNSHYKNLMIDIVKVLNVVLMTLPFSAVWFMFYRRSIISPFLGRGNLVVIQIGRAHV